MKQTILIIMVLTVLVLAGCSTQTTKNDVIDNQNNKLTFVTTVFPLYEFAKEVGGDKVEVTLLLPPGAESHSFEPKPSDIKKIENADAFIYVGEIMEPWAHDILEGSNNKNIQVIDASSLVTLLESNHDYHEEEHEEELEEHDHENEAYDPHIWLDFRNDQKIIQKIEKVLSFLDSENSEIYSKNANSYITKLQALDQRYMNELSSCNQDEFLVGGHNFFGYLEHRYNLEGISAIENLEPNTEPTPKRIKEITDVAREHNIKYILTEVLVSKQMAEAIATESGAQVLTFNPAANLAKDDFDKGVTFVAVMEDNLETLKTALECN